MISDIAEFNSFKPGQNPCFSLNITQFGEPLFKGFRLLYNIHIYNVSNWIQLCKDKIVFFPYVSRPTTWLLLWGAPDYVILAH